MVCLASIQFQPDIDCEDDNGFVSLHEVDII